MSIDSVQTHKSTSFLSGALLISGTSIGAGMLAIPFVTGVAGFIPSLTVNFLCWLFMLCTGLLFLEVTLWMPDGSNVLSMTRRFLGPIGKVVGGTSFLFLYYCLLIAYFSGGSAIFVETLTQWGLPLSPTQGLMVFCSFFFVIIWFGAQVTDRLNFILMIGLILSYLSLIGVGANEVHTDLLKGQNWPLALFAIPTLFSAFGYHNIIPSISTYLKRDVRKLKAAVIVGAAIPLVVYTVWQWLIIGSIPQSLLQETLTKGETITIPLQAIAKNPWIPMIARAFFLFALTTSILGVALSMVDFLGDGTKIPRTGTGRILLTLIAFVPPFLFAWKTPGLFFQALHYAGGFGEAVLNGLIPIAMVWIGRYRRGLSSPFSLFGGRLLLSILFLLTCCLIGCQVFSLFSS